MDGISILIGGALVPTRTNQKLFVKGDLNGLIGGKLKKVILKSDFRIFNLEVPITNNETPILRHGINLRVATRTIHGIKAMNPSLVTLANNHIMDQGKQGLLSTIRILKCNNIHYVGAGKNIKEAAKTFVIQMEGIRVGIYGCADCKSSNATSVKMGVNPFDPLESFDHINRLKKSCDYVIVLYHAGKVQYPYPTPYLQKVCQKMTEKGADFVICQQSHCIGCVEQYKNGTICYGQGNFLYDSANRKLCKSGLLIELLLEKQQVRINYIPIVKHKNTVRLANKKDWSIILDTFWERSMLIAQPEFIEKEYQRLANQKLDCFMKVLHGGNYISQFLNKITKNKLSKKHTNKQLLAFQNYIENDIHRELLLNGIKNRFGWRE